MRQVLISIVVFALLLLTSGNWGRIAEAHQQNREEQQRDPAVDAMRKRAEKQRNEQRQSDLKKDTDQLFKLAQELKKSVDSSNEHVLSLEVIRKTEEVEKLARNIRTKMKAEGYGSTLQ